MIRYLVEYSLKGDDPRKDLKPAHKDFLRKYYEDGTLICAGVFTDGPGGYLLFRTASEEETRRILEQDPYIVNGARQYRIRAWDLSPFPLRESG